MTSPSPEYQKLREELLQAEIALKEQRERVAELRRKLPLDTPAEDYVLREGPRHLAAGNDPVRDVRLSALFDDPDKPLVLMHFMYGKAQTDFCPMCTMWADGYDGLVAHLTQRVNFGVVVAGDVAAFRAYGRERGWRNLRLLSAADSTLKRDLEMETEDGAQIPGVSVFTLQDGAPRHYYTGRAMMGGGHFRGMDLLCPTWHFFDLTPEGRGDFFPQREYGD